MHDTTHYPTTGLDALGVLHPCSSPGLSGLYSPLAGPSKVDLLNMSLFITLHRTVDGVISPSTSTEPNLAGLPTGRVPLAFTVSAFGPLEGPFLPAGILAPWDMPIEPGSNFPHPADLLPVYLIGGEADHQCVALLTQSVARLSGVHKVIHDLIGVVPMVSVITIHSGCEHLGCDLLDPVSHDRCSAERVLPIPASLELIQTGLNALVLVDDSSRLVIPGHHRSGVLRLLNQAMGRPFPTCRAVRSAHGDNLVARHPSTSRHMDQAAKLNATHVWRCLADYHSALVAFDVATRVVGAIRRTEPTAN